MFGKYGQIELLNLPKEIRQWGVVSWLAETMNVSRPTLYAIGKWTKDGLLPSRAVTDTPESASADSKKMIRVTPNRIKLSIDTRKCSTDIHPNRASHLRQECTTFATGQRAKRVNC